MTIIPLGTRCSAAYIVQRNLNLRTEAYPFDWMDIHLKNIGKFLDLNYDQVEPFVRKYFSEIQSNQRHPDGTWFPHDVYGGYDHKEMTEKYVRRFLRLHNKLRSGEQLIFLSVVADDKHGDFNDYYPIMTIIRDRFFTDSISLSNPIYITVNLKNNNWSNNRGLSTNVDFIDTGNMSDDFAKWEKEIADKIIELNIL